MMSLVYSLQKSFMPTITDWLIAVNASCHAGNIDRVNVERLQYYLNAQVEIRF